jgi:hypothetical protein
MRQCRLLSSSACPLLRTTQFVTIFHDAFLTTVNSLPDPVGSRIGTSRDINVIHFTKVSLSVKGRRMVEKENVKKKTRARGRLAAPSVRALVLEGIQSFRVKTSSYGGVHGQTQMMQKTQEST